MVFLRAIWAQDYIETLVKPVIHTLVQSFPRSFFEDTRRVTDTHCADRISRILACFYERSDALLGLKAGVQPQVKIPHYLLSNDQTRTKTFNTILHTIADYAKEHSIVLRYDALYQNLSSMPNDEFLALYSRCYSAILSEGIGQSYVLLFDPHMPAELKKLLSEACDKFKCLSYFIPTSMAITTKLSFSVHANEIYYVEQDSATLEQLDEGDALPGLPSETDAPISITPIVLCAPWFPSGDDKLRKVIVQPRRGRLQDNLAISRINFRIIGYFDDQYYVHMLRSPPSYDTLEQKQLVAEAKGSKPTACEVVHLSATNVLISFDEAEVAQSFLSAIRAPVPASAFASTHTQDTAGEPESMVKPRAKSICLDVAFVSLQWLLDSLNYNELCEITDYTEQSINYVPIEALEESVNMVTVASPESPDTACKYYECHCGKCRFVFQDIEYTSPNLLQFYAGVRAHPDKYEAILTTIKQNIGDSIKTEYCKEDILPKKYNFDKITVTVSFGYLSFKSSPGESKPLSFHGTIVTHDLVGALFQPSTDVETTKAAGGNFQHNLPYEKLREYKSAEHSGADSIVLTNPRFLRRKYVPLDENFLLSVFSYIYNRYFDAETEKILLSIIKNSDNQLELRKYLKIPDSKGNLIPVSTIVEEIRGNTYKYPVILDTFLFGSHFTGIADDGRTYCHVGSGLSVVKQIFENEIESMDEFAVPAPQTHSNYANLFQMTPNKWFKDVSIIYPIEESHFAGEFASKKLQKQDYVLFRNTILHYYLTTQKRPFKCFVLYDILPIPVDTIRKMYVFLSQEGLINYNTESAMSFNSLIFSPGQNQNVNTKGSNAKEVSINLATLDTANAQVSKETLTNYAETGFTNNLLQHHALLGATLNKTNKEVEEMVDEAIRYMEGKRTPLGVASTGARLLTQALEEVLTETSH